MKHNFGVIEKFEEDKWYSDYEPKNITVFQLVMI